MVKRILGTIIIAIILVNSGSAGDSTEVKMPNMWSIDAAHSSIGFVVKHLVIAKVRGQFKQFDGSVHFDGSNLSGGSAEFTVQMASVDTEVKDRDNHLRSADFFDVEKFPTMTFKSKSVSGDSESFQIVGDLTIKDVTKEVTFECEYFGTVIDPWGNTKSGFSAKAKINRQDYNITWNKVIEAGGLVVSDEVKIEIELELAKS
jgi:polyisoprenoid-binding protein YceI